LRTLNWRRDPAVEMQIEQLRSEKESLRSETAQLRSEKERLRSETAQIEKEIALLDWMLCEMDLIKAGLPSSSTPPQATAANSNDC
jgi:hypothetical protein